MPKFISKRVIVVPRGEGEMTAPLVSGEESMVPVPREEGERMVLDLMLSDAAAEGA